MSWYFQTNLISACWCTYLPYTLFNFGMAFQSTYEQASPKFATKSKTFKCSYCGLLCSSLSHWKVHLNRHLGMKPFYWIFCEKSFATRRDIFEHCINHINEKPYSCNFCDKSFPTKSTFMLTYLFYLSIFPRYFFCFDKYFTYWEKWWNNFYLIHHELYFWVTNRLLQNLICILWCYRLQN